MITARHALFILTALTLISCQKKSDSHASVAEPPLIAAADYDKSVTDLHAREDALANLGLKFIVADNGDAAFDPDFYQAFQAKRAEKQPNPSLRQQLNSVMDEMQALTDYERSAQKFLDRYPAQINLAKADGSIQPSPTQADEREHASKRILLVDEVLKERQANLLDLEKRIADAQAAGPAPSPSPAPSLR